MEEFGLQVSGNERRLILGYLATYLGPEPPPSAPAEEQITAGAAPVNGAVVFATQCTSCHQAGGTGLGDEFPPLAGNPDLFRSREFPVLVLLYGLQGRIEIDGKRFNGVMPSFSHLTDAQIAAVVNHIRNAWGNEQLGSADMQAVGAADVAAARQRNLSPGDVHEYRARH
jgi:mono/diheme cytochrome c family protein